MNTTITIGRILRASAAECVVGCQTDQADIPALGDMVQINDTGAQGIFGLVTDIRVNDDGLVRQLVTSNGIPDAVIEDNRLNRNVPLELSVCFIGHAQGPTITHLLPPRPPLSLDIMRLCSDEQVFAYLQAGNFGYFRHLLRDQNPIVEEIMAAHLSNAQRVMSSHQNPHWLDEALTEIMRLLRNDYDILMKMLSAITDTGLGELISGGAYAAQ